MSVSLWFEECKTHPSSKSPTADTYIYKGYKLTDSTILNVRLNDFYKSITEKEMETFSQYGFITGADLLCYRRNKRRVSNYTKTLERLYQARGEYKQKCNEEYYAKKLVNCEDRILYYLDLLLLYKSRVVRYEEVNGINQD